MVNKNERYASYWNAFLLLTAREGNVFRSICLLRGVCLQRRVCLEEGVFLQGAASWGSASRKGGERSAHPSPQVQYWHLVAGTAAVGTHPTGMHFFIVHMFTQIFVGFAMVYWLTTHQIIDFIHKHVGSDSKDHVGINGRVLCGCCQVQIMSFGWVSLKTVDFNNLHVTTLMVSLKNQQYFVFLWRRARSLGS